MIKVSENEKDQIQRAITTYKNKTFEGEMGIEIKYIGIIYEFKDDEKFGFLMTN